MNELVLTLSRFIFFLSLASLTSLILLISFHSLRRVLKNRRKTRIEKRFLNEIRNLLFSDSKLERPSWLKVRGRSSRRALEDLLVRFAGETHNSDAAFRRLIHIWESCNFPEENIKRLKSRRESDRIRACLNLGIFRNSAARREIRELLHDISEKVRWAATYALFALQDEKSLQRILESISHSGRFSLIQLEPQLYELSRDGIFSLEEALQHPEPEVRMLSLGMVGRLRQAEFIRFVGRLLEDPILDVRMKALGALVELGPDGSSASADKNFKLPQEIESLLAQRLTEGSWEETARILQVVGAWKLTKFIPEIESQVTHLHPWVRYRALETLIQLGAEGRRRVNAILSEYRHIVFPILEDLDVRNDAQE